MVHSNDVESSYQQIAINVVLIIAGKLKSIIPTLSSCFCDCEKSAHWVFTCTSLIILLFCTCSVTIQYNTNKFVMRPTCQFAGESGALRWYQKHAVMSGKTETVQF